MKTSLDHLPEDKRVEIEHVKTVLIEEFGKALGAGPDPWRSRGRLLKIILYGSFSRDDWVEDSISGYKSDWDLLVVVNHEKVTPIEDYWSVAEDKLLNDPKVNRIVSLIVHTFHDVNSAMAKGEYFWADIAREGIELYAVPGYKFAAPKTLPPHEAYEMADRYFKNRFQLSVNWLEMAEEARAKIPRQEMWAKNAAFNLHQTVETAYGCCLLVKNLYLPNSHNIKFLRSQAEGRDKRLVAVWPRETKRDDKLFELLKQAYVDARYSEHYKISGEDLDVLIGRARELQRIVEEVCRDHLEELRARAEKDAGRDEAAGAS